MFWDRNDQRAGRLVNMRAVCTSLTSRTTYFWWKSSCFSGLRSTPSTCSSVRAGRTSVCASKGPWRCCRWTTCSPATSGPPTPSSLMERNLSLTTWPRPTSCWGSRMTALCFTPWGTSPSYSFTTAMNHYKPLCCPRLIHFIYVAQHKRSALVCTVLIFQVQCLCMSSCSFDRRLVKGTFFKSALKMKK